MTTRKFVLSGGVSSYGVIPDDLQTIAGILESENRVQVVYPLRIKNPWKRGDDEEKNRDLEVQGSVDILMEFLRPFGDFAVLPHEVTGTDSYVHVHVPIESNIIHFSEAPWHPYNKRGDGHRRLLQMMKRGQSFVATYVYDDRPEHRNDSVEELAGRLRHVVSDDFSWFDLSVIRRDWPREKYKGKCRIDVLIEPVALPVAPPCTHCGYITVRRGRVCWCKNCHTWMETRTEVQP